ncbi:MAG: ABC transporter permease [Anaerolineae bacterium]|nr:ABC transporter permease [Anaerolineae bacterium]
MIIKNLLGRKTRTILTLLGIAIGVAAVVTLGALGEGFIQGYGAFSAGSGADLLVMQQDALDIMFSSVDQSTADIVTTFSGVREVALMIYTFAATDRAPYFIIYGYEPDSFAIDHFKITEGLPLSEIYAKREGKPLILGRSAADNLDKSVGDSLRLYESAYRIVGIYETGEPFEDGAAVILIDDAQNLSGKPRQVNALLLKLKPDADIDRLQQRIQQQFDSLTVTRSADFVSQQDMMIYIRAFTWGVSFIAILLGAVGIMNTMLMSVIERTNEIGVFRAVGWRSRRVLAMILSESLILCSIGSITGLAIGYVLLLLIQSVPTVSGLIDGTLPPTLVIQAFMIAIGLGLFGGGLPAWRASRLTPAEAIRTDGGSIHTTRHARSSALRNILRQPIRTLLTITGIGIAMMAMIMLGSMGEGLIDTMQGFGGNTAHLVGSETDASVDLSKIDAGTISRINLLPGVNYAEGFLTGYTSLDNLPFFIVFGYQLRGRSIRDFTVVEGKPLTTNRQIMMGRVAAENLHKTVGDTLRIFNRAFRIVGIYETGVSFQDGGAVMSLRDAQNLFGQTGKVSFLSVWVTNPDEVQQIESLIESRHPEVSLSKASEFAENLGDMELMRASTWAISFIALLLGGMGMTNTMVMSINERTREIGVLRAVGWRKGRVIWMIVNESIILSMMGGLAGVAAGLVTGLLLNMIPLMQGLFRFTYSVSLFAQSTITVLVMGVLGGVLPAWRASRLLPVEALRYE